MNHLYPASTLAGLYCKQELKCDKVWMVGMPQMKEELESLGISCKGLGGLIGDPRFDEPANHIT